MIYKILMQARLAKGCHHVTLHFSPSFQKKNEMGRGKKRDAINNGSIRERLYQNTQ